MREVTVKSIKLNRDLDGMLSEALERDLLVRIGWGRGGDEKPKKGEIGAITHLPPKPRVLRHQSPRALRVSLLSRLPPSD